MSETEVLDIVEGHLNHHQPAGYRFNVSRRGVQKNGDWWYIVVSSSKEDIRARDYSSVMSQVEEEIEQQDRLKVLLLPTLPGD